MYVVCALLIGNQCIAQKNLPPPSSVSNTRLKIYEPDQGIYDRKFSITKTPDISAKSIRALPQKTSPLFSQISDKATAPFMLATALYTHHLKLWSPLSFVLTSLLVGGLIRYSLKARKYRKKQGTIN